MNDSLNIPQVLLRAERLVEEVSLHGKASDLQELLELSSEVEPLLKSVSGELFARAALTLLRPFAHTGRLGELHGLYNQALSHAETPESLAWLRIRLAELHIGSGEPQQGLLLLKTTSPVSQNTELAFAYAKGLAHRELGEFNEAVIELDAALNVAEQAGNQRGRILMLNARAGVEVRRGRLEDANPFYERSLHLAQRYCPDQCHAILSNLAATQLESRNYERAIELFLSLIESSTIDADDEVLARANLGLAYVLCGRLEDAKKTNQLVGELMDNGFWKGGTALRHLVLGAIAVISEDDSRGHRAFQDLIRTAELENQAGFMKVGRVSLGALTGNFEEYEKQAIISLAAWEAMQNQPSDEPMNALERAFIARNASGFELRKDVTAFQIDAGGWVDLSRRGPARRILQTLVDAYPEPVDAWVLFEAAWPEVHVTDPSMMSKLYTTIHRLRELGLTEIIETRGEGYVLTRRPTSAS